MLHDKICREDILRHAYAQARDNAGAPGADATTFTPIDAAGAQEGLAGLREELVLKTYRPSPPRRGMTLRDRLTRGRSARSLEAVNVRSASLSTRERVVQTAAKRVLEPIFEADFEDKACGYRPLRGAAEAVKQVHRHISRGYTDVGDADLANYFATIPHSDLMQCLARRSDDRHVPRLINPRTVIRGAGGGAGWRGNMADEL
ncbi:MAG: hypothetical protein ACRECP_09545 [Methylocella sp.]